MCPSGGDDRPRLGVTVLFEVRGGPDTVDHGKEAGVVKRCQHAVPGATVQIDALRAVCQERARLCLRIGRDDDEEGVLGHRDEGLGAFGVTLDQVEDVRQRAGLGVEDRSRVCVPKSRRERRGA